MWIYNERMVREQEALRPMHTKICHLRILGQVSGDDPGW